MSTFVKGLETHQYVAFRKEAILKAQQMTSKWEGTCMMVPLEGEMTSLDAYGETEWYSRAEAGEKVLPQDIERDRRWIASEDFAHVAQWERTEDHKNLHRFEPNGQWTQAALGAWGRKKDKIWWDSVIEDVPYGRKANKLAAFPASQVVSIEYKERDALSRAGTGETDDTTIEGAIGDVMIVDTSGGTGVEVGMNLAKFRVAQQIMLDNDIDDETIFASCHTRQINDMLNSSRFTEMDNHSMNELGRLSDRTGNTFKGVTWNASNQATSRVYTPASVTSRDVIFYTGRAIVCGAVNGSVDTRVDEIAEKHHKRQLAMYADFGVVRRIDEEVVRILCKDNWG